MAAGCAPLPYTFSEFASLPTAQFDAKNGLYMRFRQKNQYKCCWRYVCTYVVVLIGRLLIKKCGRKLPI